MRDPQRGLLSSCSASPWEWGGCALWEKKAGTSEGCKSKNTTARGGNGLARLGETKDLGVQQHPKSLFQEMNMVLCCPAMASAPQPEALSPCFITPMEGEWSPERPCCAQCSQQTSNLLGSASPPSTHQHQTLPLPCPGPRASPSPPEEQQRPDSPHAGRLRAAGTVLLSTSSSYCTLAKAGGSAWLGTPH